MLNTYEQRSKLKLTATVITILVVIGIVLIVDHAKAKSNQVATTGTTQTTAAGNSSSSDVATTPSSDASTSTSSNATTSTNSYKDGSYTASSSYYVPHGNEEIQVTLTVQSDVITAVSIQNSEGDRDSAQYQEDFASVYKNYVVGKKISGLQLSTLAGASDTTQGFNDALQQIASKAQA